MNNVDHDYDILTSGIAKLLGKEAYDKPEVIKVCIHESDGVIYNPEENLIETTLCCKLCGEHYTVPSTSINPDMMNNANQI